MAITSFTTLEGVENRDWYSLQGVVQFDKHTQLATNVVNGWRDPDYLKKISSKEDASLPFQRFHHEILTPGYYEVENIKTSTKQLLWATRVANLGLTAEPHSFPVDSVAMDLASKRYKSKFSDHYQDFQALIPLAEIKETRNLIKSTAALTERLLLDLLTIRSSRSRKDLIGLAGDLWLQYSFAIAPTIGDIQTLTDVVSSHLNRYDKENLKVSAGSRVVTSLTGPEQYYSLGGYCEHEAPFYQLIRHTENGYRYTGAYNLLLKSSNDYNLRERLGFSMKALPSVLWEIIPFSWVVDYFTTVGAYLDDRIVAPPTDSIYLVRSQRYRVVKTIKFTRFNNLPGWVTTNRDVSPWVYAFNAFERKIVAGVPSRALRFKSYDEIAGPNVINKILNLASILVSGRNKGSQSHHNKLETEFFSSTTGNLSSLRL